jgi:hypothetical protein
MQRSSSSESRWSIAGKPSASALTGRTLPLENVPVDSTALVKGASAISALAPAATSGGPSGPESAT